MFIAILQHTPTWVYGLLFALIALGVSHSFPRTVTLRRSAVLPLILVGVSLMGVIGTFDRQPVALLAWLMALCCTAFMLHGRVDTSAVRYSSVTQQFQMPGSWVPMVLMLGLFSLKFAVGVTLASLPQTRESASFALTVSAAYGVFSGIFLGRAMALWTLARRTLLRNV